MSLRNSTDVAAATTSTRSWWENLITSTCIGSARAKRSRAQRWTRTDVSSKEAQIALTITIASPKRNRFYFQSAKVSYFLTCKRSEGYFEMLLSDNFFGEEILSWLPSKNKVTDEKTEHCNLTRKFVCLFLDGSQLIFLL